MCIWHSWRSLAYNRKNIPEYCHYPLQQYWGCTTWTGDLKCREVKNLIFPIEINANRFFWDSHWLKIWKNHLCPSMGPNGGSMAIWTLVPVTYDEVCRGGWIGTKCRLYDAQYSSPCYIVLYWVHFSLPQPQVTRYLKNMAILQKS